MPKLTKQHGANFLRYVFGETPVGSADNESVDRDYSPELKAFIRGALGDIPNAWWLNVSTAEKEKRHAFTDFLREIADVIDAN